MRSLPYLQGAEKVDGKITVLRYFIASHFTAAELTAH
jgi:hypothetical protein